MAKPLENFSHEAIHYFRRRGGVIFLSYCRFWEKHGFVQQSLARELTREKVPVHWYDGAGWRPYSPTLNWKSAHLSVRQLPELPGRRFGSAFEHLNWKMQFREVSRQVRRMGGKPVIWVQAGIDEELAKRLPYIDVFSTFDDPYRHKPNAPLCQKARVILCQNSYTLQLMQKHHPQKAFLSLPPIEVGNHVFEEKELPFPDAFPKKRMGYVGSFAANGFDLPLFERFVSNLPDWGFFLMGRTDDEGLEYVKRLKRYSNFLYFPWAPRQQVASAWKALDLSLLLYKRLNTQDGAFPTKVVESLYFNKPCIATAVPKTLDLEGFFPRENSFEALKAHALRIVGRPHSLKDTYAHFFEQTSPGEQLHRIANILAPSTSPTNATDKLTIPLFS